jgi:hypothetical protein
MRTKRETRRAPGNGATARFPVEPSWPALLFGLRVAVPLDQGAPPWQVVRTSDATSGDVAVSLERAALTTGLAIQARVRVRATGDDPTARIAPTGLDGLAHELPCRRDAS